MWFIALSVIGLFGYVYYQRNSSWEEYHKCDPRGEVVFFGLEKDCPVQFSVWQDKQTLTLQDVTNTLEIVKVLKDNVQLFAIGLRDVMVRTIERIIPELVADKIIFVSGDRIVFEVVNERGGDRLMVIRV